MTKRNEIESRDRRKKTCAVRSVSTIVSFFGTIFFWKYPNVLFCFFLLSCSPWNEKKRPKKEEMNHFGWRKKETRKMVPLKIERVNTILVVIDSSKKSWSGNNRIIFLPLLSSFLAVNTRTHVEGFCFVLFVWGVRLWCFQRPFHRTLDKRRTSRPAQSEEKNGHTVAR